MDGLKNYREKIKSIEKLVDKMESGELSINELVELEGLTRDLHERSIILKYKAFENKSGVAMDVEEEAELIDEVLEEAEAQEEEVLFEADETPVMDFSMFDTPAADEKVEEPAPEPTPEVEVEKPEPVVEKKPEHKIHISTEPVAEEPKTEPEVKPEPIAEEPIAEEPKATVSEKGSSFLDRLNITDNSISSQLAGRKIDTLSGAFGINQRLLYINELFDGSGEAFSDAVKTLDTQPGLDEASAKVEELAFKNSWDPEEETVLEFLAIIKRRYA
jgi:chemotaxis protein histidine kinase CheA